MASGLGVTAMALTKINSTCDILDFVKYCGDQGIKPIAGAEIRNGQKLEYILIVANNKGFAWINNFLSTLLEEKKDFPAIAENAPFFQDLSDGFVIYPLGKKSADQLLGNERIGVLPSEINKLWGINAEALGDRYVIRQPVTFQNAQYYNLHKVLRAVDLNIVGTKLTAENLAGKDEFFLPPPQLLQGY